jgi:hypothetical protein
MNERFRILTGVLYVLTGAYFFFMEIFPGGIDPKLVKILGTIFAAYGVYRIVHTRLYCTIVQKDEIEAQKDSQ